jgi:hypothetical protein
MKTKAEALDLTRGQTAGKQAAGKRSVTVRLSQLAFEALAGEERDGSVRVPGRTESAIRLYLGDKGAGRPAWPYPGFLRQSQTREDVGLELDVDPDVWLQFEAEAERQSVSAQQLLEHAAFYFAAELNAGRLTQRILDDLESGGETSDAG